ncbi:unnamed protein product, partial [marine sediment metagenome]
FQSASKLDPARAAALLKGQMSDSDSRILERRKPTGPMSKSELSSRAQRGQSQEQIEAEAIKRSYDTVGTGGYIIEHANGALEWVPNGPGDQPQPPTGDVFFDPIAIEQQRTQSMSPDDMRKLARGGAVRKFEGGGLAAVTDVEEEMETPEGAIEVDQIVERATNPAAGQSLTSMILQNKQDALDRLRHGRTQIAERRDAQQKRDESQKWLSFAQGMLAPTRTGSFGESLGTTAGLLAQQTELRSGHEAQFDEQLDENMYKEIAMEGEAIDQMLKLSGFATANRAKSLHGAIQTMTAPEDKHLPVEQRRIIFGAVSEGPDGQPKMTPLRDDSNNYWLAASKLDPDRVAALMEAAERAESQTHRSEDFINEGYLRRPSLVNLRRAITLLENAEVELKTSTVQGWKNSFANAVGIDLGDTTELTEWQMAVAEDFLTTLTDMK